MKQGKNAIEQALRAEATAPAPDKSASERWQGEGDDPAFDALVAELAKLISEGGLAQGFDLEAAGKDPALVELMQEYGAAAGIRVYAAEQRAAEAERTAMERLSAQMRMRGAMPKSARGGSAMPTGTNYRTMDGEAFRALVQQMKRTARDGGKTRL